MLDSIYKLRNPQVYLVSLDLSTFHFYSVKPTIYLQFAHQRNKTHLNKQTMFAPIYKLRNPQVYLLSFQHLSESRFLLGALNRSKFVNFCHDLMQNHLS